ncbi:MAG: hemerythrin domain-containing protein [Sandaracinaceae bacterium]
MPNKMEEVVSKVAGKAKRAGAAMGGLDGVFRTIVEQHGEALALLQRCKAANEAGKRRELWKTVRSELLSHEKAELREVYPELAKHAETREIVAQHEREANELEEMIHKVDGTPVGTDTWHERIVELTAMVKQHADEEQNDFLPRAQAILGSDRAEALDRPFRQAKERLMNGS